MKILAIESAAKSAGAAVFCGSTLLSEQFINTGLTHSQTLMPLVDAALSLAGVSIGEIDGVAVSCGPGSFTGVRIGLGTAKGLALGAGKPLYSVPTLLALAYNVVSYKGMIVPIMDARRGEVYTATYRSDGETLTEITPMRAIPLSDLLEEVEEAMFVGDGVMVHKAAILDKMGERAHFAPDHLLHHRASSVGLAAMAVEPKSPHEVEPFYLRLSQAEREYMEKEKGNAK
ncbi:MAG: tRNA (adenosine(37)-N6)-threonylcarbamoyltransferase complex dimerization subunit type 1 TsaB [Clostridia bacterium]|nr:tRNA (adenosine(37)-N6)-threonylcarbamoyltransferase complex dimerization subunit type 1 TsaB [Clostridia bacterium]